MTDRIMLPPPCQGGMASSSRAWPYSTPIAGGAGHLVAAEGVEVRVQVGTSTGRCGTPWAPSTSTGTPLAWARRMISLTGLMVPSDVGDLGDPQDPGAVA